MPKNKPSYQDLEKLIIDLKSANKKLQNKDRFNMLLQASDNMITVHKPCGKYIYYNGPKHYNISTKEIVGKYPKDLFSKNIADTLMNSFNKVRTTGKSETIEVLLDWLGEKKWFSEYIYPSLDEEGKVIEIVKVCKDIHQRKITEIENEKKNRALFKSEKELKVSNNLYRKLNKELEKSESNLRTLKNTIPDFIWLKSIDGKFLFVNNRVEALFGAKEKDIIGKTDYDFIDKELAGLYRKNDQEVISTGLPISSEELVVFPEDNHSELLKTTKVPVFSKENEIIGVLGVAHDVSDQRKIEQELKASNKAYRILNKELQNSNEKLSAAKTVLEKSELNLRTLINTIPDLIWLKSVDGRYLFVNNRFEDFFGAKEQDIVGKTDYDFVDKELADFFREHDKKAMLKGAASINEELVTFANDNHSELLETTKVPIRSKDKDIIGVLGIGHDITERRKAEKELIASNKAYSELNKELNASNIQLSAAKVILEKNESNLRTLINTIPDLIWLKSVDGKFLFVNNRIEDLFGVKEQYIIGKTDYDFVDKELADFFREHDKKAMLKVAASINEELVTFANDNHSELLETTKVPIRSKDKDIIGVLGIGHDITEQRKAEKELEQKTLKLDELNKSLNQAQKLSKIGNWQRDIESDKAEWSDEMYRIYGVTKETFYPSYKNVTKLILEEDMNKVEQGLNSLLNDMPFVPLEFRIRRPSGEIRNLLFISVEKSGKSSFFGVTKDITQQKKREEEKFESLLNFKKTKSELNESQKLAQIGSWTLNPKNKKMDWSEQNFNIWGFDTRKKLPKRNYILSLIHPDDIELVEKSVEEACMMGTPFDIQFRICPPNTDEKIIRSICKPVLDITGNVINLKGTNQDISKQVNQQEKVLSFGAESRAMKSAVDSGWSSAEYTLDGIILKANDNLVADFGYSSQKEFIGEHHKIFHHGPIDKKYKQFWNNLAKGKEQKGEFKRIKKDGSTIWINANYTPVKNVDGNYYKVINISKDISEMVKDRFKVSAIANELRQFIETANAPIFGIDNNGLVNEWNQTSEKITGFKKEEVLGENLVVTYITKGYQKSVKRVLYDALLGKETANYEFPLFAKNGARVMVLLNSTTRRDANGNIIGVLGVGQDITELVSYRKELEVKVNERTLKLNESLEKQKELNELKSRFVSTASHEFRTPLSAINFAAGSIKKYWDKMEPTMIDRKLHKIEDQVLHMTKLLDDVLMVGQADVGKMINKPSYINLGNFIYEIIEEINNSRNNSRNNSHEIVLVASDELINSTLFIDEKLGRNIFINLIDNALKFSPEAKKVVVEILAERKYTVFKIQDFGIGIPKAEINNIFSPFTRGENVDLIQGTGLGLSIVKEAVNLIGGEIIVNSSIDKGTTFIVKIPNI
jgi:PAS domain S-box-containing protein